MHRNQNDEITFDSLDSAIKRLQLNPQPSKIWMKFIVISLQTVQKLFQLSLF